MKLTDIGIITAIGGAGLYGLSHVLYGTNDENLRYWVLPSALGGIAGAGVGIILTIAGFITKK